MDAKGRKTESKPALERGQVELTLRPLLEHLFLAILQFGALLIHALEDVVHLALGDVEDS